MSLKAEKAVGRSGASWGSEEGGLSRRVERERDETKACMDSNPGNRKKEESLTGQRS